MRRAFRTSAASSRERFWFADKTREGASSLAPELLMLLPSAVKNITGEGDFCLSVFSCRSLLSGHRLHGWLVFLNPAVPPKRSALTVLLLKLSDRLWRRHLFSHRPLHTADFAGTPSHHAEASLYNIISGSRTTIRHFMAATGGNKPVRKQVSPSALLSSHWSLGMQVPSLLGSDDGGINTKLVVTALRA